MRKPSKKKVLLGLVVLVLVFIAVSGIVTTVRHQAETKEYASWAEAFQPLLGEYLHSEYSLAGDADAGRGYIRGKLVVVDSTTGELDDLNSYKDLADLRARSPEEVGTVVLTAPSKGMVVIYENLKVGFQWTIEVTVVDIPAKMIVSRRHFTGSMPPEKVRGDQAGEGERPTAEIIAFLKSLPRK